MQSFDQDQMCPRCHFPKMRTWDELDADERFLVQKLPASGKFTDEQRRRHFFCPRCWYEEPPGPITV